MRLSMTMYVEEEEEDELLYEVGQIIHNSLRRSDIIMRKENDFYLLVPGRCLKNGDSEIR